MAAAPQARGVAASVPRRRAPGRPVATGQQLRGTRGRRQGGLAPAQPCRWLGYGSGDGRRCSNLWHGDDDDDDLGGQLARPARLHGRAADRRLAAGRRTASGSVREAGCDTAEATVSDAAALSGAIEQLDGIRRASGQLQRGRAARAESGGRRRDEVAGGVWEQWRWEGAWASSAESRRRGWQKAAARGELSTVACSQMQQCNVSMRGPRWLQQHSQDVSGTRHQGLKGLWSGQAREARRIVHLPGAGLQAGDNGSPMSSRGVQSFSMGVVGFGRY